MLADPALRQHLQIWLWPWAPLSQLAWKHLPAEQRLPALPPQMLAGPLDLGNSPVGAARPNAVAPGAPAHPLEKARLDVRALAGARAAETWMAPDVRRCLQLADDR